MTTIAKLVSGDWRMRVRCDHCARVWPLDRPRPHVLAWVGDGEPVMTFCSERCCGRWRRAHGATEVYTATVGGRS